MQISRRSLFRGLGALIVAPAVIRVAELMPIKPWRPGYEIRDDLSELMTTTLRAHSREIAENITNNNALLQQLKYAQPNSFVRYAGYDWIEAFEAV